jgi:Zn-dependent M16 (insulinase) family peptidase
VITSPTPEGGMSPESRGPHEFFGLGGDPHLQGVSRHSFFREATDNPQEARPNEPAPTQWCGFTLIRSETIEDTEGEGLQYQHDDLGLGITILRNRDRLRSCRICLHTPSTDSTGKEHILEHDAFRGDEFHPSQDPVWEYQRGSANYDSNAETNLDVTTFYFSSPRPQDFSHLLDLFVSAVFFSRNARETFLQEAWRIETDPDDPEKGKLRFNGIVLNEMKGACAGVHNFHDIVVPRNLFPQSHLRHYSGGLPLEILKLTHAELKAFRDAAYHPSNAKMVFAGDVDPKEVLEMVAQRLSGLERREYAPATLVPPDWEGTRRVDCTYPGAESENRAQDTLVSLSWELGSKSDPRRNLALDLLSNILVDEEIGVITQALSESGLGNEPSSYGLWDDTAANCFTISLAGASYLEAPQFEELVFSKLSALLNEGISPRSAAKVIRRYRLSLLNDQNDPNRGSEWADTALSAWMYGGDPFEALRVNAHLSALEESVKRGEKVFEPLIAELLSRPRLLITLRPDRALLDEWTAAEEKLLEEYKGKLGSEGLAAALEESATLPERVARFDTVRAKEAVPRLNVTHLRKRADIFPTITLPENDRISALEMPTRGLVYLNVALDLSRVPEARLPYASILARCLFETGTRFQASAEYKQRMGDYLLSIEREICFNNHFGAGALEGRMVLGTFCFAEDIPRVAAMLRTGILDISFDDRSHIAALMREQIDELEASLHEAESAFSTSHATGLVSARGYAEDLTTGILYLRQLRVIEREARRGNWRPIKAALEETRGLILSGRPAKAHATCSPQHFPAAGKALGALLHSLERACPPLPHSDEPLWPLPEVSKIHGVVIPSQVNYLARAIPLAETGWRYHASADVICNHLYHTAIWDQVRRQGGAYGGSVRILPMSKVLLLSSHSDPNIAKTLKVFSEVPRYIRELANDAPGMRQSIVRSVCENEAADPPDLRGQLSFMNVITGIPPELEQQHREERMGTTPEHYHAFAEIVEQALREGSFVVLGSRKEIEQARELGLEIDISTL